MSNNNPSAAGFGDLTSLMQQAFREQIKSVWTMLPGKIESFSGQRAKIQIGPAVALTNGKTIAHPPLVDVPVQFFRWGGYSFTMPVSPGDEVAVFFSARSMDQWLKDGDPSKSPQAGRFFSLSDAFAVPGLNSAGNLVPSYNSSALEIKADNGSVVLTMTKDGDIKAKAGTTDLVVKQNGNIVAETSGSTMTLTPAGKFTVANSTGELNSITQSMLGLLTKSGNFNSPSDQSTYISLLGQRASFV